MQFCLQSVCLPVIKPWQEHFSNWSCPLFRLLFLMLPASPLLHYSHPYRHKYKGISWQMTNLLHTTTTPSVQPVIHLLQFLIYFVYFRAQALRGTSSAALMKSATAPFYRWLLWQLYNQVRSTRLERFVQLRTIISSVALRICDSKTKTEHLLHQLGTHFVLWSTGNVDLTMLFVGASLAPRVMVYPYDR